MENQTSIIFFTRCKGYYSNSTPLISWTSKFSESVQFRHLNYLVEKTYYTSEGNWETLSSVIVFDQIVPSFLALQPYWKYMRHERKFRFRWYTSPDNLNFIDSTTIPLDPEGGKSEGSAIRDTDHPDYFDYIIHCCVRPTLRCCINDLPVEILEMVFSSFTIEDRGPFKVIPCVCAHWHKVALPYEVEPTKAEAKLVKLKKSPVKRFKWDKCYYKPGDVINFNEYVHVIVQFQPYLKYVDLQRPSQEHPLGGLLLLAEVPTIEGLTLNGWTFHEVFGFLQARRFKLHRLNINDMTLGPTSSTKVILSNGEMQNQSTPVDSIRIRPIDNSIHSILSCLQKDHLQSLELFYQSDSFEILDEPINLLAFKNLVKILIDGGNEDSNILSYDFIPKTFTSSNLPNLRRLHICYCFVDPRGVRSLLHIPALEKVDITFFMSQKTEENERLTNEMMDQLRAKYKGQYNLSYSDGDSSER